MASEKEASEELALEETVVGLLKKKKMTLSLAESCTGGAVAADIVMYRELRRYLCVVMSHIQTAPKENVLE